MSGAAPDLILHSGRIYPIPHDSRAVSEVSYEAMAIKDGAVVAVGSREEVSRSATSETRVDDLGGRTVLPGFIESHAHLAMYGETLLQVDCRPAAAESIGELLEAVGSAGSNARLGAWVLGWGWDESRLAESRVPTRDDLDSVLPDTPVLLTRTCGHMAVANSAALRVSGVDETVADPTGGRFVRDGAGRLTGLVQENAMAFVAAPAPFDEDGLEGLERAQGEFLARGITSVHDLNSSGALLRKLARLRRDGRLRMRVRPWLWALDGNGMKGHLDAAVEVGTTAGFGDDWVRIQGMKFMLDGSVGGLTAAVSEPYVNTCEHGILIRDAGDVTDDVIRAIEAGLRVAIHGIGDRAVDVAVRVLEAAFSRHPDAVEQRHRIEHCALPSDGNLDFMAEHGVIAGSSVGFLHELGDRYIDVLGPERMERVYPQRSFADRGIVAPPNSDCPVTDSDPWPIIRSMVTRRSGSGRTLDTVQNVTVEEAVRGYTRHAAFSSFEEGRIGTLVPGAWADMVVLPLDPFGTDPEELPGLRPEVTYVAGEAVHRA